MSAVWIQVDLAAIRHNYAAVQELVGPHTAIIAVIKANAYGHGAVQTGQALAEAGAPMLAVTRVEEALPLRAAGITTPILLLAPPLPEDAAEVVEHQLTATVTTREDAAPLAAEARRHGREVGVQLKINTGMGRLGVEPEEAVATARGLQDEPGIRLEAAFTHFAAAAERDAVATHNQYALFQPLVHHLSRATGLSPQVFHCANSAALLRFPSMRLSRVRCGTLLFGQYPSPLVAEAGLSLKLELKPTFQAQAKIVAIKLLLKGQRLGYGGEWKATRATRIATVAVGYADGLGQTPRTRTPQPHQALQGTMRQAAKELAEWAGLRAMSGPGVMELRGHTVPLIGRVGMQLCSLDISGVPEAVVGDVVNVPMRRTSAGAHLPRRYSS